MKFENFNLEEDTIKFSNTLNKDLWDGYELKPKVLAKLKEIANAFIEYLDIDIKVNDIIITGSMANYNFNEDSDIDLHIITRFDTLGYNFDLVSNFFNIKKTLFNQNHSITIYNHPVELYIEDFNKPSESKGKFSIISNKWLIKPQKITQEIEDIVDSPKYLEYIERINTILSSEFNSQEAENLLDELYEIRKQGLLTSGELSEDNLIFKKLRNLGLIKALRDYIVSNFDKSLSLNESVDNDRMYRDIAEEILVIVEKYIYNNNPSVILTQTECLIDVTSLFKKILNKYKIELNKNVYLRFIEAKDVVYNMAFGSSGDDTLLISFPIFPKSWLEITTEYMHSHHKTFANMKEKYTDKEIFSDKISKWSEKICLKYIKKYSEKFFNDYPTTFIHEIIHLLDFLRRSKKYKQNKNNDDLKTYYNSSPEQNAYYQETMYFFDKFFQEYGRVFTDFNKFFNIFTEHYYGDYSLLTTRNKERIKRRAYKYWKKYQSIPKYQDFNINEE